MPSVLCRSGDRRRSQAAIVHRIAPMPLQRTEEAAHGLGRIRSRDRQPERAQRLSRFAGVPLASALAMTAALIAGARAAQLCDRDATTRRAALEHAPCVGAPGSAALERKADRFARRQGAGLGSQGGSGHRLLIDWGWPAVGACIESRGGLPTPANGAFAAFRAMLQRAEMAIQLAYQANTVLFRVCMILPQCTMAGYCLVKHKSNHIIK